MGTPQQPLKVKLFIAVLYDKRFALSALIERLRARFGSEDFTYGPVDFSWTDYYAAEMGEHLGKLYITYSALIEREMLPTIKLFTNGIEGEYADGGKRTVNIDPGYLARDKLVLASTKDFYHRLYLGNGIYGEVTLHFRRGVFRRFSWTYPDYQEEGLLKFLVKARASMVGEIRKDEGGRMKAEG
jgi:Domain of unknown function (DUF4416)